MSSTAEERRERIAERFPPQIHSHVCPFCGEKWTHDGAELLAAKPPYSIPWRDLRWDRWIGKRKEMHTCKKCGERQYERTDGTYEP